MSATVTVALPIRDGAQTLAAVLEAVRAQRLHAELDLLVCDSGSHDGSVALARRHGARVLEIAPERFAHGPVRNLLMAHARGSHVALLTQDAVPADEHWLARLLEGFDRGPDVGLVYGPYRPRRDADAVTARELERWFRSLAPDGRPRVDRLEAEQRGAPAASLLGRQTFFTDANACVSREAWRRVPFRDAGYAEDQALAVDMLRAGYAKVFVPGAGVVHSHRYTDAERFRRAFDEWRGLREVYGWREPARPARMVGQLRGELGALRRELAAEETPGLRRGSALATATRHHVVRMAGAMLGSHADRLPSGVRRWCSLDGRADFAPLADTPAPTEPVVPPLTAAASEPGP